MPTARRSSITSRKSRRRGRGRAAAPVILSASRRTDLPGWHADALAERLDAWIARHGRERLYGVVFWTRFPGALARPPLRRFLEGPDALPSVVVNLTVTGLGGTRLEPRAPAGEPLWRDVQSLAAQLGDPRRLRWRFDPLLPTPDLLDRFRRWADRFAQLGVNTCTISFPAVRSLRGPLRPRYARLGVPQWPADPAMRAEGQGAALSLLTDAARDRGIGLFVCSQPDTLAQHPALRPAQCIPPDVLALGHLAGAPGPLPGRDATQRAHCQCAPSQDLGDYRTDACRTGCLYCYSTLGGPDAGETLPWFLRGRE